MKRKGDLTPNEIALEFEIAFKEVVVYVVPKDKVLENNVQVTELAVSLNLNSNDEV